MKKTLFLIWIFILTGFTGSILFSQVDSQWRGPNRDGVYPGETLSKKWPDSGPKLLWSVAGLEEGFSSVALSSKAVYVTGMKGGTGYLFAFSSDGKQLWKKSYGPEWSGQHPGARTTPTIVGDKIYLISGQGNVVCFDEDGKQLWLVDLAKDFGARNIKWGITESLLIDENRLFCTSGGSDVTMAVLDRNTGKTILAMKGNGENSGYCSPVIIKHGNRRLLLTMTARSVVGFDADTGKFLWKHPHVTDYDVNPNTPLYYNGQIFTVSGYGTGGQMFKLSEDGNSVKRLWAQSKMDSQMGSAMLLNGFIYGSGHKSRGWFCLDWQTGEVQYSSREAGGKGNIIFSDGMLYCYSEKGDVAMVKPNPKKFEIVSSFRLTKGSGPHWAHPVIRDGRLYVRHGEILMVYDIAK